MRDHAVQPKLAGRQAEVPIVRDVLASRADPTVLLVTGEAGIGKTALVGAVTDGVRADGVIVLAASCLPLTEAAPLLPIADIMRTAYDVDSGRWLRAAIDACPAYVASSLASLLPELATDGDTTTDSLWRQRFFAAVRLVLGELGRDRQLAIVLEDAHWSDSSTLDLLDHLLHAQDGTSVPIVVTFRSDDESVAAVNLDWLGRARRSARTSVLELARLTQDETAEQIALVSGSADPAVTASVFARSEGNPLFTEQLLGSGGRLPVDLRAVFDVKLQRLDAAELAALNALAVVGRPLPTQHLEQLVDDPAGLASSLRSLRAARLLRADTELVTLRHALLADAVLADLAAAESARLERRVAEAMPAWGEYGSPGELAEHWQRAGDARNELEWRVRAAEIAYATHANAEAVHQWSRVVELWDDVPDAEELAGRPLHEVYLTADWAFFDAGMTERSVQLIDAALERFEDAAPVVVASLMRRQARNLSWTDGRLAADRIEQARALFAASGETVTELIYCLHDVADMCRGRGRYEVARAAGDEGVRVATELGEHSLIRRMYLARGLSEYALGDVEAVEATLAELAAAPEPDTLRERIVVGARHADLLLAMGKYADVPAAARDTLGLVLQFGAAGTRLATLVRSSVAEALLLLGRVAEAEAAEVLGAPKNTGIYDLIDVQRAEVMMLDGDMTAADATLAELAGRWSSVDDWTPYLWSALAEVHLWQGRAKDALADLDRGVATMLDNDYARVAGWLLAQAARAGADLAISANADRDALRTRLDELRASLAVDDPFDKPGAASAAALRATWDAERARLAGADDPVAWAVAAREWETLQVRFRAGYCRWRQAESLLAQRARRPEAIDALRAAATSSAGHVPLVHAIEATAVRARIALVEDVPAPAPVDTPRNDAGLTERELAVLRLVAAGLTNAQIGAELFMSAKTASVHVTNILRKLGVATRTHAAAVAQRSGLLDEQSDRERSP